MKILVKAKTKAKKDEVVLLTLPTLGFSEKKEMVTYKVSVTEAPVAGRANLAIAKLLANFFAVPPSRVALITGQTSKQKVFEIIGI